MQAAYRESVTKQNPVLILTSTKMPVNLIHSINNTIYLCQRIVVSQSMIHKITKGREEPGIRLNESCS